MTDPVDISDDTVFNAVQAIEDEAACWRLLDFNGRGAVAVKDRAPINFDQPEGLTAKFEKHDFSSRNMAERYIQWRAVKAALLAVRAELEKM